MNSASYKATAKSTTSKIVVHTTILLCVSTYRFATRLFDSFREKFNDRKIGFFVVEGTRGDGARQQRFDCWIAEKSDRIALNKPGSQYL